MIKRLLLASVLTMVGSMAGWAQEAIKTDFSSVIAGTTVPLTVKIREINGDWRLMNVTDSSSFMRFIQIGGSGISATDVYTKGQTIMLGNDTLIVAYHFPLPEARARNPYGSYLMDPFLNLEKLTADSNLTLCLVSVHGFGSIGDIRPTQINEFIKTYNKNIDKLIEIRDREIGNMSFSIMTQLGYRLKSYITSHGKLPVFANYNQLAGVLRRAELEAYERNAIADIKYAVNPSLSGKAVKTLKDPAHLVLIYETKSLSDGTRGVVFANGTATRLTAEQWTRISKQNNLS
jgi:hypothetical protein